LFVWRLGFLPPSTKISSDQRSNSALAKKYYEDNILTVIFGGRHER
jgi:hypothetical protein